MPAFFLWRSAEAIGAENIGSGLIPGSSGDVTLETVIAQRPDVHVMTGRQAAANGAALTPMGYNTDTARINAALTVLERRNGFAAIEAVRNNRVFAISLLFCSHPHNIVGLEWLTKMAYADELASLDPAETYRTIISRFTTITDEPFIHAVQAPRLVN